MDGATRVAKDLLEAIQKLRGLEARNPGRHTTALEALVKFFKGETENLPNVTTPGPQTSTNLTQPESIQTTLRVHAKRTRNNTPGILPTIEETQSKMVTSEGAEISTEDTSPAQKWYAEPRGKRTRVRKTQQQKSPRLNKTQDSPVETNRRKQDDFEYDQHDTSKVYDLGVPNQQKL